MDPHEACLISGIGCMVFAPNEAFFAVGILLVIVGLIWAELTEWGG